MIYRDERRTLKGVWNRTEEFTSNRQIMLYGSSIDDVAQYLTDKPAKWSSAAYGSKISRHDAEWDLGAGYDGALRLAKDGWSEGVEMVDEALQAIVPSTGREARWGWSQSGGSVSIGRYLTQHPKCMRNRRRKQMGAAPVLHLIVNTVASCAIRAEQMANYGACIVGLIDRLENMGRRVHLDVVQAIKLHNNRDRTVVRFSAGWNVKRASEPVDLSQVAFAIAHPAAFRRIGFALMERAPAEVQTPGYGHCCDGILEDVPDFTEGTMIVDGVNHEPHRCNTPKDALRLAIEQVNKAAVIAGHATIDQPLINEDEWLRELAD